MGAGTGACDQIESLADIEGGGAAFASEGIGQVSKISAGIHAAHAAAVKAEDPEWP
jgi:hypothetical protein